MTPDAERQQPPKKAPFVVRLWRVTRQGFLLHVILLRLPPRLAAFIDRFRRGQRDPFGGPANNQQRRLEMIRSVFERIRFLTVVETGTYRGSTTEFLADLAAVSGASVITVEVQSRFYWYARWRLRKRRDVKIIMGDSVSTLRSLGAGGEVAQPVFFYLDAHWEQHLPLREEVELIQRCWRDFVILVDDFQVPGDPGYAFDDYGPDARLTIEYLEPALQTDVARFWPAAHSSTETSTRKGCLVLASASLGEAVRNLDTLRQ